MQKPKAMTLKELDSISTHEGNCYKFDFSRITNEKYRNLILAVKSFALTRFTGLGFNIDLLKQTEDQALKTQKSGSRGARLAQKRLQKPAQLNSSVIVKNKNAVKDICSLVGKILPESQTLNFLKFRSLQIAPLDLERLCKGIYASNTLRTLRFCDIDIGDSGFERLARALRKRSVVDLQLRHCGLTDASGEHLHRLLSYHMFVQSQFDWEARVTGLGNEVVCLKRIDLRDNEFTFQFVAAIKDSILDVPLEVLDLRGNIGISPSVILDVATKLRLAGNLVQIRTGHSKEIKAPKSKRGSTAVSSRATSVVSRVQKKGKVQKLEEENEQMRNLIKQLESGENVVELEPGLRIVGPRSKELVEHLMKLDELMSADSKSPTTFHLKR